MKEMLNKVLSDTVQKWAARITIGILAFLCTWGFTTIMEMNTRIIKLEQKIEDDKTQWSLIQQVYEGQIDHEVRLRFFELIIDDIRNNGGEIDKKTEDLLNKIDELKEKRSVDEFKDYHKEQQQQIQGIR
jgi:hypothetical protein